ncbi:MAG: protein kinase [Phycisphaeraceae bacterium]|nr:protein kinase [Phycisphaeraceae bacterium]
MSEAPDTNPAVTSLTAKAGDKVDNYTIMEQVGAGGTAIVFRGHDHVLNRDVAIKQIVVAPGDEGEDIRQRALAEAAIHKRVAASDPRLLVQYIDTVNDPRGIFLISEYVDGPSLEWILQQENKPMDQRQALGIIAASAKALDALHQGGVVHRDLKPSNILMPREGGLKLADFGLAAIVAEQQTLDLGSVRYMAPELLQGETATPKSDLYSLGIVAYEMLAGRDNFNSAFRTILRDQRNQSMRWVKWHTNVRAKVTPLDQLVDGIPASLAELVARMMEKDPARRVGSCAELLEAIRMHFAQEGQGQAAPGPHAAMAPPKIDDVSETAAVPQKSKLPMILAATLMVWLLAIGGFFIWKKQQAQEQFANAKAALTTDIEAADDLIDNLQFEEAIKAYGAIPTEHPSFFETENNWGLQELVESGSLKAQALLAAENEDYITALKNALAYQKIMASAKTLPSKIDTSLRLRDAKDLVEEYDERAAFLEICFYIETLFAEGKLDEAVIAIREVKETTGTTTATQDELDQIAEFEQRYATLVGDQRIAQLLGQANRLDASGDLEEAIDILETEIEDAGEGVDKRVTALADQFNKRLQIQELEKELAEAERSGDPAEILAARQNLQRVQPTQGNKALIDELEIQMMVAEAGDAIAGGRPDRAEPILVAILKRDPDNTQAPRMLASLKDARMMVELERQGDELLAQGKPQGAIEKYQQILALGPDTNGTINEKIKQAAGQVHFNASELAFQSGDLTKAQDRLDKARNALGDTDPIADLQDKIDELREYTLLVTEGDGLYAKEDFGGAKRQYLAAKKIFDSEAINQKVSDCDFGIWLATCDRAILSRDWPQAESALKRAEEIKTNEQTRARREQIENRVQ